MLIILILTLLSLSCLNGVPFKQATTPCAITQKTTPCAVTAPATTPCASKLISFCIFLKSYLYYYFLAVNPCKTNPCLNGGQCLNSNGVSVCQCVRPFYGSNCQYCSSSTPVTTTTTTTVSGKC